MAATLAVVTAASPESHTEAASPVAVDTEAAATLVAVGTEVGGTGRKVVPPIPLSQPKPSLVQPGFSRVGPEGDFGGRAGN
jgi:hypothetical protein